MKLKKVLLLGLFVAASPFVAAQESAMEPVADDNLALLALRDKLKMFEDFSASFTQKVFDVKGQQIQTTQGNMQVQQPNKFRWQTFEPDESLIVSDGDTVWIHNPFVEQVTAMDLEKTVQQSPLWLIANQSDDAWHKFTVSKGKRGFIVVPKDQKSLTKQIIITFSKQKISQLYIEDSQGQSSEFNLYDFDANPGFNDKLFHFELPEGVDFDDQREAK